MTEGETMLRQIHCRECGTSFSWTAREQRFYAAHKLDAPNRCPTCRHSGRRVIQPSDPVDAYARCPGCGSRFVPIQPRQVHCRPSCGRLPPRSPAGTLFATVEGAPAPAPDDTGSR